jgi:hypothetical protein
MAATLESYFAAGLISGGILAVLFLGLCIRDLWGRRDLPLFSSEWKGLGTGLSGWRISRPLAYALLGVTFALAAVGLIAEKVGQDYSLAAKKAEYEYELQKQRESEERKYRDADSARKAEIERGRLTSAPSAIPSPRPEASASPSASPASSPAASSAPVSTPSSNASPSQARKVRH